MHARSHASLTVLRRHALHVQEAAGAISVEKHVARVAVTVDHRKYSLGGPVSANGVEVDNEALQGV